MRKPQLLVLAGGLGSRYGGWKQIDRLGPSGEAIIDYSVYNALEAGFGKIVFVIKKELLPFFEKRTKSVYPKECAIEWVIQELTDLPAPWQIPQGRVKPWGTGHALYAAREKITAPFMLINSDDCYEKASFRLAYDFLYRECASVSQLGMVGYSMKNTLSDHGAVSRGVCEIDKSGSLISITEKLKLKKDKETILDEASGERYQGEETVSMNLFLLHPDLFEKIPPKLEEFLRRQGREMNSEFYVPHLVSAFIHENLSRVKVLTTQSRWFGITYQEDRLSLMRMLQKKVAEQAYPSPLFPNL